MFTLTLLLSLAVGLVRGGRLGNLLHHRLQLLWLVVVAFALRAVIYTVPAVQSIQGPWLSLAVQTIAYGSLLIMVWFNRRQPGMLIFGAGAALNYAAIATNSGRMPVAPAGLLRIGGPELVQQVAVNTSYTHQLADETVRLYWLTDLWPLPPPFPLPTVFSLGDVVIAVGAFLLIQSLLRDVGTSPKYIIPPG